MDALCLRESNRHCVSIGLNNAIGAFEICKDLGLAAQIAYVNLGQIHLVRCRSQIDVLIAGEHKFSVAQSDGCAENDGAGGVCSLRHRHTKRHDRMILCNVSERRDTRHIKDHRTQAGVACGSCLSVRVLVPVTISTNGLCPRIASCPRTLARNL